VRPDTPTAPDTADVRCLQLAPGRKLRSRVAGIFLFLPLLARLRLDRLIREAGYPGSRVVPAPQALLSLLALKLLDKERRSHIDDFNTDEALGLFAGLNILPKKSFAADYSYRTQRQHQQTLLQGWVRGLAPLLFPAANTFALDFHTIPHRGDATGLDNHYFARARRAGPGIVALFAQEHDSRVLCYANADLTRADQEGEPLRFVEFWHALTGSDPAWLYFDSKLVPYGQLSRLNQRPLFFVTIRRRGAAVLRRLEQLPAADWHKAVIDIPKRRHQTIRYLEERVRLRGYEGEIRQVAVTGLGRERATLFLSNNFAETPRNLIIRYAQRNRIEDGLGQGVNFFHLDCLASEVRLNVDVDVALTVVANGCYRWLASRLRGYDRAAPKQLFRKFVETSGVVKIGADEVVVCLDRRAHHPVLREAALTAEPIPIPWLGNKRLVLAFA
jgi:hypothetical protein